MSFDWSISFLPKILSSGARIMSVWPNASTFLGSPHLNCCIAFQSTYSLPSAPALTFPNLRAATESRTQNTNWRYSLFVISVASIQKPLIDTDLLRALKAYAGSSSLGPIWKVPWGMYTMPGGFGNEYLFP